MCPSESIDIVYLWVDGNDPTWRDKRRRAAQSLSTAQRVNIAPHANVEGRFRDNDELRFSLRALETHFPQHGHVYIVTDGQSPGWLRPHARLSLVDHRDLIPRAALPTFDSGNIESYIHRIPGLSERYFYFNDDVFFGAPVRTEDWFWDGGIYAAWSAEAAVSDEPPKPHGSALGNACRRSIQWLDAAGAAAAPRQAAAHPRCSRYRHTFRTFAHAPRPMLKSMLFELEDIAPELFEAVRSTVFRDWAKPTIVSDFVMRWALAHGRARVRDYRHLHVSSGADDSVESLHQLSRQAGALDFFCVNDTTDDAPVNDPRLARVRTGLQALLARPSSFEQARGDPGRPAAPGRAAGIRSGRHELATGSASTLPRAAGLTTARRWNNAETKLSVRG